MNPGERGASGSLVPADSILESFIRLGADLVDIGCAAFSQFRVMVRIPCARGNHEGLVLFVTLDFPTQHFDGVGGSPLALSLGQLVELARQCLWDFDDFLHGPSNITSVWY